MTYVVVIRREGAKNDLGEVYRTKDIGELFKRLRQKHLKAVRPSDRYVLQRKSPCARRWVDAYIRAHYGRESAQEIADHLTDNGIRVTKNMIVGYANRKGIATTRKQPGIAKP